MKKDNTKEDKTKNKKKKPIKMRAGVIIVILFAMVYTPVVWKWLFTDKVEVDVLRKGSIEESANYTGIIIRDETVFSSDIDGKYIYEVVESKKVPKGVTIASVVTNQSESVTEEINKLNAKIKEAQIRDIKSNEAYSKDISRIDAEIKAKVDKIVEKSFLNEFRYSDNHRREIDSIIQDKANFSVSGGTDSAEVKALKAQLQTLEAQRVGNTHKISSPFPGFVSYVIDGYENILKTDSINALTHELYEKIKNENNLKVSRSQIVNKGRPFVKLITGNYIYIAMYVDESVSSKMQSYLNSDSMLLLNVYDVGKTIEAKLHSLSEPVGGKSLAVFKTNDLTMETSQLRKLNVNIIFKQIQGYKVPLKCLIDYKVYGDTAKIVLLEPATAVIKSIKCLGDDGTYAIIEPDKDEKGRENFSLYDRFVVEPEKVKEGQVITR